MKRVTSFLAAALFAAMVVTPAFAQQQAKPAPEGPDIQKQQAAKPAPEGPDVQKKKQP